MRVLTKPYGEIDVDERQRLSFPFGILGFEELHDYVLLDASQQPFYWLQSVERPEVAFVLIDPKLFRPDYTPDLAENELAEIGIASGEEPLVFAVVTIPENQALMSANLQGPVVINRRERIARQSISLNPVWKIRHYVLEELSQVAVKDRAC